MRFSDSNSTLGKYYGYILLYSILGIIAVGVAAALVGIVPLRSYLKKQEIADFSLTLTSKTKAVEQYLSKARDVSLQITSRSRIRDYLEAYNKQEINLDQLVRFTAPKLEDAMNISGEVSGISRFDKLGNLIVHVGLSIPEEFHSSTEHIAQKVHFLGPILLNSEPFFIVCAHIINREDIRVGTDLVLFKASAFQKITSDYSELGETGEIILVKADDIHVKPLFPLRKERGDISATILKDSRIGSALSMSIAGKSGILHPDNADRAVIAYRPISNEGWGIAIKIDERELYAPVNRTTRMLSGITAVLILAAIFIMLMLLLPLTRRLQTELAERVSAEEELRESESRFRQFFENEPEYCYMISPDGLILDVNKAALDVLGYMKEEIVGKPVQTIYAPESLPIVKENIEKWKAAERLSDVEMVILTKSGDKRTVLLSADSVKDAEGKVIHSISVQKDITERKKTDKEIKTINAELLAINRIVTTITGILSTKDILQRVLDESLNITGLEGGTICMVAPDETLELAAHKATSEATIADLTENKIKIGECLCGECARDHKPLILRDRDAVLTFATREATRGEDIRFHAAFPLITGGKCLGVLCVFTRTDNKPHERILKLLETISSQIALAVENAQLYEKTVQHAATLEDKVRERTSELEQRNTELERLNKLFVDREFRIKELKERVKELEKK